MALRCVGSAIDGTMTQIYGRVAAQHSMRSLRASPVVTELNHPADGGVITFHELHRVMTRALVHAMSQRENKCFKRDATMNGPHRSSLTCSSGPRVH